MHFFEHKLVQGEGAGRWLPFARQKVAALHARAKAMRVTALVQRWTVEGGDVEIAVRVVGDQRYIHIRRKECPLFASGLADGIIAPPLSIYPLVPLTVRVETTPEGDPNPRYSFRRFFPSAADAKAQGTSRAPIDEPRLARNPAATDQSVSFLNSQLNVIKASQYSGEMRKVVQILQGANEVIPYKPLFGLTHGVWKARDGQRWIIEVTVNGVVAWAMGMCRASSIKDTAGNVLLDYVPIATPKPTEEALTAAIAAGTFRFLNTSDDMRPFYINTPFFPHCGWAFNSDGHEAANVCYTVKGATYYSLLFKITITDGGTSVEDTGPVTAAMTVAEEGYLFGTTLVHPKYPKANGALYSFDTRGPVPVHSACPLYCFYDGDNLLVARHEFTAGSSSVTVSSGGAGLPLLCPDQINTDLLDGTFAHTAVPSISMGSTSTPSVQTNFTGSAKRFDVTFAPVGAQLANFSVSGGMAAREHTDGSTFDRSSISDSQGVLATLIIPFFDREAAFVSVRLQTHLQEGSITMSEQFVTHGPTFFSTCTETCIGTPDRCVNVLACAGGQATQPFTCDGYAFAQSACYYPNSSCGSVINTSMQDDAGCVAVPLPCFSKPSGITLSRPPAISDTHTFVYIASGGVSRAMPIPPTPNELTRFIEEGVVQRMVSIRDAFSDQYMISPHVDPVIGQQFVFAPSFDYPTEETYTSTFFVGVP